VCRRERDAQIFTAIKTWELGLFHEKTDEERTQYVEQLSQKSTSLEESVKNMPSSIGNKHRRWRAQSDIEQF